MTRRKTDCAINCVFPAYFKRSGRPVNKGGHAPALPVAAIGKKSFLVAVGTQSAAGNIADAGKRQAPPRKPVQICLPAIIIIPHETTSCRDISLQKRFPYLVTYFEGVL